MFSILLISVSVVNAGTVSDASFNWATQNIPGTQLDFGQGAQILTAENLVNCDTSAAATVIAIVKQTEAMLSNNNQGSNSGNEAKHISYGYPLMCNINLAYKNACQMTCPSGACNNQNKKTLKMVQELMGNPNQPRVLPRHFDTSLYSNGVYNGVSCEVEVGDFVSNSLSVPTYSTVKVDSVAALKGHILNGPVIAYVKKTIFATDAAVFDINSYGYSIKSNANANPTGDLENELANGQDVRAVLLIGWGTTGSTLFWRALAPYGSTKGSYGVVSLTQPSNFNNAFFRTIGIATLNANNQQLNTNKSSSGSDSKLSAAAVVFISLGGVALICLTLYFCRSRKNANAETRIERMNSIEIQN